MRCSLVLAPRVILKLVFPFLVAEIHAVLQGAEAGKKLFPEALRIIKASSRGNGTARLVTLIYLQSQSMSLNRILFSNQIPARAKPTKSNGGWGDLRDRQLCESFVIPRNDQAAVIHDHNGHN